jgi:hypothetical protein
MKNIIKSLFVAMLAMSFTFASAQGDTKAKTDTKTTKMESKTTKTDKKGKKTTTKKKKESKTSTTTTPPAK